MFHKLRMQFAMVNAAVILLLFVLLTTGSYLFINKQSLEQAELFSERMATGISLGMFPEPPPGEAPLPFAFFVKADERGKIMQSSAKVPMAAADLETLVSKVLDKNENKGLISLAGVDYYFNRVPPANSSANLIIFQEFSGEKARLHTLVASLAGVGFICLLFSLLGSFFLGNQVIKPIQKSWQQQIDFLADVSHELRTPLAVVRTNLDIVIDNPEDSAEVKQKWLHNIKEETEYMTEMVDSLLFLASSDAHQLMMDKKVFNLNQVVNKSVQQFQPGAMAKDIVLRTYAQQETYLNGDEFRVKQVVEILLDNALRHTPAGGIVSLSILQSAKTATLLVTDTGEGIPAEHLDKIFNRFYQAEKSRSKGGAGLGLSIAKCIIENHGGSISLISAAGKGSTFKIDFPIAVLGS